MSPGVSGWDGRFWFYYDKIYLVLPNGSVIFLWSPSLTVFGGQFSIVTLYTLLTTTDCHSVPHEKHVSPPTPPPPSVGDKFWLTTYKLRSHRRNLVEVGHRTECNPEALSAILRFPFLLAPVSWKKKNFPLVVVANVVNWMSVAGSRTFQNAIECNKIDIHRG